MSLSFTVTIPFEAAAALCNVPDDLGDPRTLLDDASIYAAFRQVVQAVKASPYDLRRLASEKHSEPPPSPTITSLSSGLSSTMLTPSPTSCASTESYQKPLERPTSSESFAVLLTISSIDVYWPSQSEEGRRYRHFTQTMRDGAKHLVQVNGLTTSEELRVALMNQEGIPSGRQRLVFNGEELEDDRTLESVVSQSRTSEMNYTLIDCSTG